MVTDEAAWLEYQSWNDALAEHFFGGASAGRPVYLDVENDVLDVIARRDSMNQVSIKPGAVQSGTPRSVERDNRSPKAGEDTTVRFKKRIVVGDGVRAYRCPRW